MENPSCNERWKRAGIEDNMLLTMFDASDTNQDAVDERKHHSPLFRISSSLVLLPIFAQIKSTFKLFGLFGNIQTCRDFLCVSFANNMKKQLFFCLFIYEFVYAGIAFLDAVRASSIGLERGKPPTS